MGGCEAGTLRKEASASAHTSLPHTLLSPASLFLLPSISLFQLHWPLSEAQAAEHPQAEGINTLN